VEAGLNPDLTKQQLSGPNEPGVPFFSSLFLSLLFFVPSDTYPLSSSPKNLSVNCA
jgi:hypothetical protein